MPAKKNYNVSKEELYDLYIIQNKMVRELSDYYDIPFGSMVKIIRKYGLKKGKEANQVNIQRAFDEKGIGKMDAAHKRNKEFLEEHGYYPPQKPEVIERRKQTNIKKFGCENPFGNDEIKEKIKHTMRENFGTDYAGSSVELQTRSQKVIMEKYGVYNYGELALSEFTRDILSSAEKLRNFIVKGGYKTTETASKAIGCGHCTLCKRLNKFELWDLIDKFSSHYEEEISKFLDKLNVKHYKTKTKISPYEIDAYCPDYNIGIEFNGDYWHSTLQKEKDYHLLKYNRAKDKGVFIFYVYEYEWVSNKRVVKERIKKLFNGDFWFNGGDYIIENGKIPENILIENGYKIIDELPPKSYISGPYEIYNAGYKHWSKK